MARYVVTPELAEAIKTVRIKNGIASKDLASHLGKSAAFVTKLEKGEVKTIKEEDLTAIVEYIVSDHNSFSDKLESLVDAIGLHNSPGTIEKQVWLMNYDWVMCRIPLPDELSKDILAKMREGNISIDMLSDEICKNSELDEEIREDVTIPFNEWQGAITDGNCSYNYIKLKITADEIDRVLHKSIDTNYVTIYAIVRFLHYLLTYRGLSISDEISSELSDYTEKYLNSYKFYSISERKKRQQEAKSVAELDELLSEIEIKNSELVGTLTTFIEIISELNVADTNVKLEKLLKNIQWDCAFSMMILSQPYYELSGLSFTNKKELLGKIKDLIAEYKQMPDLEKALESYD